MYPIVRCFTWYIGDVHFWLPLSKYSMRSPTYSLGNSQCKFYLQFVNDRKARQVGVFVCPDGEFQQVETIVSLVLKTVSGRVVGSLAFRAPFPKEGCEDLAVTVDPETLPKYLENEKDKDKVIVTCEFTLLEPTFPFLNEDIKDLSADLLKLRSDYHSADAGLIAEGELIHVHKEIVCSRSPVLGARLKDYEWSREDFPAPVLRTMLDYMYSGSFSLKELDAHGIEQLSACALHYEVRDLAKIMAPRRTCVTSLVHTKTETHTLQFPNFRELCKSRSSVEHHKIKMQFIEDITMTVKFIFQDYHRCGKIRLETKFWNLVNVKNLLCRVSMFDPSTAPTVVDEIFLDVSNEETSLFCLEYGSKSLFSRKISALPNDVLALRYEIKFQFNGQLRISDLDCGWLSEGQSWSHEVCLPLVKNMESLMKSELYANAFLVLPSRLDSPEASRIRVHKSILSVRSPVFKDLFRTSQEVPVNQSKGVVNYLLQYAYTGLLLSPGARTLSELHAAAGTYRMHSLKRACEEAAAKMPLNIKNVFYIRVIAVRGEKHELQERCKDFLARNKNLVFGSCGLEKR